MYKTFSDHSIKSSDVVETFINFYYFQEYDQFLHIFINLRIRVNVWILI